MHVWYPIACSFGAACVSEVLQAGNSGTLNASIPVLASALQGMISTAILLSERSNILWGAVQFYPGTTFLEGEGSLFLQHAVGG